MQSQRFGGHDSSTMGRTGEDFAVTSRSNADLMYSQKVENHLHDEVIDLTDESMDTDASDATAGLSGRDLSGGGGGGGGGGLDRYGDSAEPPGDGSPAGQRHSHGHGFVDDGAYVSDEELGRDRDDFPGADASLGRGGEGGRDHHHDQYGDGQYDDGADGGMDEDAEAGGGADDPGGAGSSMIAMGMRAADGDGGGGGMRDSGAAALDGTGGADALANEGILAANPETLFDLRHYDVLQIPDELRDVFRYIEHHAPGPMDFEPQLKPFPPDYIPALGAIDSIAKVTRPDGQQETLGISVLDEPAPQQSEAGVVELRLREEARDSDLTEAEAPSVPADADEQTQEKSIREWIESIGELHRSKPPATVTYMKPMPDIEDQLMVEFPEAVQEAVRGLVSWGPAIDLTANEYARIICTLFDVPIHEGSSDSALIESLHLLFTVYSEFAENPFFNQGKNESEPS